MFEVDSHGKTNWKNFQEAENVYLRHFLGIWGFQAPTPEFSGLGNGGSFPASLVGWLVGSLKAFTTIGKWFPTHEIWANEWNLKSPSFSKDVRAFHSMALQECFSISSNTCRKGTCANLHGIGKLLAYIIDYKYRYKILQIHISYIVYWYINIHIYICTLYIMYTYIMYIYIYLYTYIISNIKLYIIQRSTFCEVYAYITFITI